MAEVQTVEVVDDYTVPAERTPSCTREFFLRPPDWRYQSAVQYLKDEQQGVTPTIPTDPLVQYAIRILRAFRSPGPRVFLEYLAPDAVTAVMLGVYKKRSAIVADIEGCLIQLAGDGDYLHKCRTLREEGEEEDRKVAGGHDNAKIDQRLQKH